MPRREEVLDRAVVQLLRELLALAFLHRQRLGDQTLPLRREQAHGGVAACEKQREEREGKAEPGEVGGLHEHEGGRAVARPARVRHGLYQVRRGRRRCDGGRPERPCPERDHDDREQEREAHL